MNLRLAGTRRPQWLTLPALPNAVKECAGGSHPIRATLLRRTAVIVSITSGAPIPTSDIRPASGDKGVVMGKHASAANPVAICPK